MTKTTAYHRNKAREAKEALCWAAAAYHYERAIELYPNHDSELAKLDIANLTDYMLTCRYMLDFQRTLINY